MAACSRKPRQPGPLDWPLTTMRLAFMWGARGPTSHPSLSAWMSTALISAVMAPSVANAVMSGTLPAVIETSSFAMLCAFTLLKIFTVAGKGRQIAEIHNFLRGNFKTLEDLAIPLEADVLNRESLKASNKFCRIALSIQCQSLLLITFMIAYSVLINNTRALPFLVIDVILSNATYYWSYVALLYASQYLFNFGAASFDTLYLSLCIQLRCKGRILKAMFDHIQQRKVLIQDRTPQDAAWNAPDSERCVPGRDLVRELHRCVRYHQQLIRLHEQVEGVFARSMLYILLYFVVALGAPALRLMQDKNARVEDALLQVSLLGVNLMQLSFICCFGDMAAEASEEVRHTAFLTYRQAMSPQARSALVMILLRTGKPLYLTADRAVYLTVNLLMAVLRRSHSIYSAAFNLR